MTRLISLFSLPFKSTVENWVTCHWRRENKAGGSHVAFNWQMRGEKWAPWWLSLFWLYIIWIMPDKHRVFSMKGQAWATLEYTPENKLFYGIRDKCGDIYNMKKKLGSFREDVKYSRCSLSKMRFKAIIHVILSYYCRSQVKLSAAVLLQPHNCKCQGVK